MTWIPIFDASGSWPDNPAACYADGYRVAAGYRGSEAWKTMTAAMVDAWHGAGLGIAAMFESTGTEALQADADALGARDGAAARAGWRSVGMPDDRAIAYAVDTNVSMAQYPHIKAYFAAVKSVDTCLPWAYIEPDIGEQLHADGLIGGIFAPAAWSWDPAGAASFDRPHVYWRQKHNGVALHGGDVDTGEILDSAPIWWPGTNPHPEDDMPITSTDCTTLTAFPLANGETLGGNITDTTGRIKDLYLNVIPGLVATAAGIVKTEAAIQAALSAGGGNADTAALAAQIKTVGDAESAQVASLLKEITSLRAALAKAATDGAADISAG